MKTNSKYLVAILLAGVLLVPQFSYGLTGTNTTTPIDPNKKERFQPKDSSSKQVDPRALKTASENRSGDQNFCTQFSQKVSKLSQEVNKRRSEAIAKVDQIKTEIRKKDSERKVDLTEKRSENEVKFNENVSKLDSKVSTLSQKQAVASFKSAMIAARAARKAAVDKAQADFRAGMEAVANERKNGVASTTDAFRAASNAAIEKAKADCAAGVDANTIKDTLNTSLRAAKTELENDRKSFDNSAKVQALVKARNAAIRKAHDDFKAILKAEIAKLKVAIGAGSGNATSTPPITPTPTSTPTTTPSSTQP